MTERVFSDIYQEFYQKVLQYLTRLVGEHEAEDVAQVTFEKVNSNLSSFKGESKCCSGQAEICIVQAYLLRSTGTCSTAICRKHRDGKQAGFS
jgi:hypothetical protein